MREEKPSTPDDFMFVLMFFKNLSATPGKLVKFTRKQGTDGEQKWEDDVNTQFIKAEEGKKDIIQNAYLVEGNKILITGNFFYLLNPELETLKLVHCSASNDRFFVSTLNRPAFSRGGFYITILPYLSDKKSDYNPRD